VLTFETGGGPGGTAAARGAVQPLLERWGVDDLVAERQDSGNGDGCDLDGHRQSHRVADPIDHRAGWAGWSIGPRRR